MATGEKKTEGVRFDWDGFYHAALKRIALAKGFDGHNELARKVVQDFVRSELHAATLIVGDDEGAGIVRNFPERRGAGRK